MASWGRSAGMLMPILDSRRVGAMTPVLTRGAWAVAEASSKGVLAIAAAGRNKDDRKIPLAIIGRMKNLLRVNSYRH
jgi:hypothetical protein